MHIHIGNSKQEVKNVIFGEYQTTCSAYNLTLSAITRAVFSPDYHIKLLPRWLPNSASREGIAEIKNQDRTPGDGAARPFSME